MEEIEQGYLAMATDDSEVRVRRRGDAAYLTVKRGSGLKRTEVEIKLDPAQFDELWPLTAGRRVSKSRHYVPQEGATIEVDVYRGSLAGLVIAEVEFSTGEQSERFDVPGWFAEEVTEHGGYANKSLATRGIP